MPSSFQRDFFIASVSTGLSSLSHIAFEFSIYQIAYWHFSQVSAAARLEATRGQSAA
jgi:hypothetical protein